MTLGTFLEALFSEAGTSYEKCVMLLDAKLTKRFLDWTKFRSETLRTGPMLFRLKSILVSLGKENEILCGMSWIEISLLDRLTLIPSRRKDAGNFWMEQFLADSLRSRDLEGSSGKNSSPDKHLI